MFESPESARHFAGDSTGCDVCTMNEFKFLCPHCQQSIEATPEYCGAQINCPSCHAPIVVPDASTPPPMRPGKLTKAASTVHYAATTPAMAAAMHRKARKPRTGLYVGLGVGVAVAVAAVIFVPKLLDKYNQHKETARAEQAATNAPPPPPPESRPTRFCKSSTPLTRHSPATVRKEYRLARWTCPRSTPSSHSLRR